MSVNGLGVDELCLDSSKPSSKRSISTWKQGFWSRRCVTAAGPAGSAAQAATLVTAAALKPWAVDSLTHTNKNLDDGTFCKDLERAESFVKAANGV